MLYVLIERILRNTRSNELSVYTFRIYLDNQIYDQYKFGFILIATPLVPEAIRLVSRAFHE